MHFANPKETIMAESVKTATSSSKKTSTATATKKTVSSKTPATPIRKAKTPATTTVRKTTSKTETSKPVVSKITDKPATPRKKPIKSENSLKSEHTPAATIITPEHRYQMIAMAAYFIAEKRGFTAGHEIQDWITAESQINAQLLSA